MNFEASNNHTDNTPSKIETDDTVIKIIKKRTHAQNNKAIDFKLDIDAGAKRIKCRLNRHLRKLSKLCCD